MTMTETPTIPETEQLAALFTISYRIGGHLAGAPTAVLHLTVETGSRQITGYGQVTWAVSPPVNIGIRLEGTYTYVRVMGNPFILISLSGYPLQLPVQLPVARIQMFLTPDWESGTADLDFTTGGETWHHFSDLPVKRIVSPTPESAEVAALAPVTLTPDHVSATWSDGTLTIKASGRQDGIRDIRIVPVVSIYGLAYAVVGERSPRIGNFPYEVSASFEMPDQPAAIFVVTPKGAIEVPVN